MSIGGFLASQSERDHYRYLSTHTLARVQRACPAELEREVCAVLAPVGVDDAACAEVTRCLREVEARGGRGGDEEALRWEGEVGLTAFLMKFSERLGTPLPLSPCPPPPSPDMPTQTQSPPAECTPPP
jgi:vacuolar iron transporter family protein